MCEVLIPFRARTSAPTMFSAAKSLLRIGLQQTATLRGLGGFHPGLDRQTSDTEQSGAAMGQRPGWKY